MPSSQEPTGWIAFKLKAGTAKQNDVWLDARNQVTGIHSKWDYPPDSISTKPSTTHFAQLTSISTKVERDYAGINSSGGPQVAGRADHDEIEITKASDCLTPTLYQFVSTGEQFSEVLIVLPEYGGSARVEWLLEGVNLTLFEFTGSRIYKRFPTPEEYLYPRLDKIRLLYTKARVRVGTGGKDTTGKFHLQHMTDLRGWDTGGNCRLLSYPEQPDP